MCDIGQKKTSDVGRIFNELDRNFLLVPQCQVDVFLWSESTAIQTGCVSLERELESTPVKKINLIVEFIED